MDEHKFPQEYNIEEWVDLHRGLPDFDIFNDMRLREDHMLRTDGPAGLLATAALTICQLVDADGKLTDPDPIAFRATVKSTLGLVATQLEGTMPDVRWIVHDYQLQVKKDDKGKVTLDLQTRPINNILRKYWELVSN